MLLAVAAGCGGPTPAPDPEAQRRELETVRVTIRVEAEPLGAVLAELAEQTGRPIALAPAASHLSDSVVRDLVLEDVSLAATLTLLQSVEPDLAWIPDGRGALFDLRSDDPGRLVVQIHALANLTAGLTGGGTPPPTVLDEDIVDEDNPLFGPPDEEDAGLAYADAEVLLAEIRAAFPPRTWDPPAELRMQGRHTLVAKQTLALQEELARFLDRWRARR